MKAAPFAYVRPSSLSDAVAELATTAGEGKVIAGGQSLTPVLAMRLARPETLIDITAVAGLDQIVDAGGVIEIGATVRQRRVEHDPACSMVPLLRAAMPWVGHREIRSRGTVCGSVAHADPAAELPAIASCVDAELVVAGPDGSRSVRAREFFTGAMMTSLSQDEIVTAVRFPAAAPGEGFGFAEIARRHGDFALAGVATRVRLDGETIDAVLTGFGISDRPVTRGVSDELTTVVRAGGSNPGRMADDLRDAVGTVADEMVDTDGDAHASRDYRRRLFRTLTARELSKAYHRARSDIDEVNE